jgi:hypothetical protein
MGQPTTIDVNFDFRQDTPPGADPDRYSPTLRSYHRLLWSKPLPGGAAFALDDGLSNAYLYHRSPLSEFFLSSDSVIPSFRKERTLASVFEQIPASERDEFLRLTYTIGGMMVLGPSAKAWATLSKGEQLKPDQLGMFVALDSDPHHALDPLRSTLFKHHGLAIGLVVVRGGSIEKVSPPPAA